MAEESEFQGHHHAFVFFLAQGSEMETEIQSTNSRPCDDGETRRGLRVAVCLVVSLVVWKIGSPGSGGFVACIREFAAVALFSVSWSVLNTADSTDDVQKTATSEWVGAAQTPKNGILGSSKFRRFSIQGADTFGVC